MIEIILLTHGNLSKAFMGVASRMCHFDAHSVTEISVNRRTDVSKLAGRLRKCACKSKSCGTLILTDLFGGSTSNIAALVCEKEENVAVMSGLNVTMLFSALYNRDRMPFDELVAKVEEDGKRGIVNVSEFMRRGLRR